MSTSKSRLLKFCPNKFNEANKLNSIQFNYNYREIVTERQKEIVRYSSEAKKQNNNYKAHTNNCGSKKKENSSA